MKHFQRKNVLVLISLVITVGRRRSICFVRLKRKSAESSLSVTQRYRRIYLLAERIAEINLVFLVTFRRTHANQREKFKAKSIEMLIYCAIAVAAYFFYKWVTANNDYFEKRGIPFHKPVFLLGSNSNIIWNKMSFPDIVQKWYYERRPEKFVSAHSALQDLTFGLQSFRHV